MRTEVLVAIPAHDEADLIVDCLESVIASLRPVVVAGAIRRARIAVAAHRCADDTAALAREVLAAEQFDHLVTRNDKPVNVGAVRTELIIDALGIPTALDPRRTWIFSTDADTVVPPGWIGDTLAIAADAGADLVAGLADVVGWSASMAAQQRYARLVSSGLAGARHTHAYAANLAIRAETFLSVGGFPDRLHGEEHGLLDGVRRAGGTVLQTTATRVRTSGRTPGRTMHGLAALLDRIATDAEWSPVGSQVRPLRTNRIQR